MKNSNRFKIYIAAYLVLFNNKNQILLLQRKNTGYQDGKYSLVSGHFDGNETVRDTIIREAKEEANITLQLDDLEVVHIMHRISTDREYIDIYIKANKWTGDIKNIEPNKCDNLKWFSNDNLPKNIVPAVDFALNNIKTKMYYSEFGW